MARSGSRERAAREGRRQPKSGAPGSLPPESTSRSSAAASTALASLPEDATEVRDRSTLTALLAAAELEENFFRWEPSAEVDLVAPADLDEERSNPELSPAQHQRRRQLRRLVAMLMVSLLVLCLAALRVQ